MSRTRQQTALQPRVKVWLEAGGQYAFGFGLCEMLRAVDDTGSLKRAAAALGKSYRYVWGRVKEAEEVLGLRLVETRVGGQGLRRSSLTPSARHLVKGFLAIRARLTRVAERAFRRLVDDQA